MRLLPREAWGYAILMILLCAIGAIAAWQAISYLDTRVPAEEFPRVAAMVWALTLGFMFTAGAFGLWATRFAADAESRRRVGRFVDAMDYIGDGLLVLDRRGRITGSNPAAADLADTQIAPSQNLGEAFHCLSADDVAAILAAGAPSEIERIAGEGDTSLSLRFRSYPAEDMTLLLVSDVTAMNARHQRSRQVARLQLIGHIARGVARDFNSLLCGISGHAALLGRMASGSPQIAESAAAIAHSADRGIALAGQLLELARSRVTGLLTDLMQHNVRLAADALRYGLPDEWRVEFDTDDAIPPVGLSRMQFEQVLVNLGLLAADALGVPGLLRIEIRKPAAGSSPDMGVEFAAVATVSATRTDSSAPLEGEPSRKADDDSGVIESVIASMLEEAGGHLESMTSPDGTPFYRIGLPRGHVAPGDGESDVPDELKAYMADWSVLLAVPPREHAELDRFLAEAGMQMFRVDNIMDALGRIEEAPRLDAVILDSRLLSFQVRALLKAILKLRPDAGLVVLSDDRDADAQGLEGDVIFESPAILPGRVAVALMEAKSLAAKRGK